MRLASYKGEEIKNTAKKLHWDQTLVAIEAVDARLTRAMERVDKVEHTQASLQDDRLALMHAHTVQLGRVADQVTALREQLTSLEQRLTLLENK